MRGAFCRWGAAPAFSSFHSPAQPAAPSRLPLLPSPGQRGPGSPPSYFLVQLPACGPFQLHLLHSTFLTEGSDAHLFIFMPRTPWEANKSYGLSPQEKEYRLCPSVFHVQGSLGSRRIFMPLPGQTFLIVLPASPTLPRDPNIILPVHSLGLYLVCICLKSLPFRGKGEYHIVFGVSQSGKHGVEA